ASIQVRLDVTVPAAPTGDAVTACRIQVLDEAGTVALATFEGSSPDGTYSLPAPSGPHVLRVEAKGFERSDKTVTFPTDPPVARETVHLTPK
ncbi:MAG: hypothetical protein ACC662_00895, partial [Planctomycetota bacterium]